VNAAPNCPPQLAEQLAAQRVSAPDQTADEQHHQPQRQGRQMKT
jgi:hypothetical protein